MGSGRIKTNEPPDATQKTFVQIQLKKQVTLDVDGHGYQSTHACSRGPKGVQGMKKRTHALLVFSVEERLEMLGGEPPFIHSLVWQVGRCPYVPYDAEFSS